MGSSSTSTLLLAFTALAADWGCGGGGTVDRTGESAVLGPKDGRDLPPVDLDRVQVGDEAPDFSLQSYAGQVVTLSDFRGEKDVVLVFYRGHW